MQTFLNSCGTRVARFALATLLLSPFALLGAEALSGFVPIKGGTFYRGAPTAGRERPQLRVDDFEMLAQKERWIVERKICLAGNRTVKLFPNLAAEVAVFLIRKSDQNQQ